MFQDKKTWEEAEQECENSEGHLVSILTEEEQTMIFQVSYFITVTGLVYGFISRRGTATVISSACVSSSHRWRKPRERNTACVLKLYN